MPNSYLQEPFLRVLAANHKATAARIASKLQTLEISPDVFKQVQAIVQNEIRGLYHGNLVVFDGGSCLADYGMIKIVDDQQTPFARNLHEICLSYFDDERA